MHWKFSGASAIWKTYYGYENVSNTNNTRGGASEHGIEREGQKADEGWKGQSQFKSSRHDKNVSNTNSRLSIGENKEVQARRNTIDDGSKDVSNTKSQRLQRHDFECELPQKRFRFLTNQVDENKSETWWQIESKLRGIPDGLSYKLDKDRSNRIKSLGNAIVVPIAREFAIAIKKNYENS